MCIDKSILVTLKNSDNIVHYIQSETFWTPLHIYCILQIFGEMYKNANSQHVSFPDNNESIHDMHTT